MRVELHVPGGTGGMVLRHAAAEQSLVDPHLHRHDELELNIATAGRGRVLCAGRWSELRPGMALWLFPGHEHMLMEQSRDFAMWVVVWHPSLVRQASRTLADPSIRAFDPPVQHRRLLAPASTRRLGELCSMLHGERHPGRLRLGLGWLLAEAWGQGEAAAPGATLPPAVERAMVLIQEDGDRPLPALAAACGCSPAWLSRTFRRHTGTTLTAWKARTRLSRALAAWRPGTNLLDLALAAGFGSYNRFHAACHRWIGCSPRTWTTTNGARPVI